MPSIGDSISAEQLEMLNYMGNASPVVVAVLDAPNIDWSLNSILGRPPTRGDRPNFSRLREWMITKTTKKEVVDLHEISFKGRMFINFRADNMAKIEAFVSYMTRQTGWSACVKNKGDVGAGVPYQHDIDLELLEYLKENTPKNSLAHFYVMTNDLNNVGDYLMELAKAGHWVTLVCFTNYGNFEDLIGAGVKVYDYRDIEGVISNLPPKPIDIKIIAVGESRVFEAQN
jgi:hypothetical protein